MATIQEQIATAKAAGYSDADIAKHLSSMQDFAPKIKAATDAGYKPEDIISHLSGPAAAPKAPESQGIGDQIGTAIFDARKKIEAVPYLGRVAHAVMDVPRGITQVIAHGVNAVAPSIVSDADLKAYENAGSTLEKQYQDNRAKNAGANGKPADPGFDWTRTGVNALVTAPFMATKAATLPAMVGKNALAGGTLGLASPVDDGNADFLSKKTGQVVGGTILGGAAPLVINPLVKGASSAVNALAQKSSAAFNQLTGNARVEAQNVLNAALKANGTDFSKLPQAVQDDLLGEVAKAVQAGGKLDADALRRKADFLTIGAKPVLGQITRDPVQFTREQTLKGVQGAGQQLADTMNFNNRALIGSLNKGGASAAPGTMGAGQTLVDTLGNYAAGKKSEIGSLYSAAKDSSGRAAALDPSAFTQRANDLLDQDMRGAFVPDQIRTMMNKFAAGEVPLNIHSAEQFKTIIGNAQRGATDGNVRAALGHIRSALDDTPLLQSMPNGGNQVALPGAANIGQDTIEAFNKARAANRTFMGQVEGTPSLSAALDGAQPDKFFNQHVIGATVGDLKSTLDILKTNPAAVGQVKSQIVDYLKSRALNGATDEVGNFSQAAYNKALKQFGDDKLKLLFSPEELNQLKAVGRVASYMQTQPAGSAVNNSNTASQGFNLLMKAAEKVPGGKAFVVDPLSATVNGSAVKNSLAANVPVSSNPLINRTMQNNLTNALLPLALTTSMPAITR